MKEILVWLHVQMGNERLEKYPKDISKDRNDRTTWKIRDNGQWRLCGRVGWIMSKVIFTKCNFKRKHFAYGLLIFLELFSKFLGFHLLKKWPNS